MWMYMRVHTDYGACTLHAMYSHTYTLDHLVLFVPTMCQTCFISNPLLQYRVVPAIRITLAQVAQPMYCTQGHKVLTKADYKM